jgi:hypothetical protein
MIKENINTYQLRSEIQYEKRLSGFSQMLPQYCCINIVFTSSK